MNKLTKDLDLSSVENFSNSIAYQGAILMYGSLEGMRLAIEEHAKGDDFDECITLYVELCKWAKENGIADEQPTTPECQNG
jgi:hypothetical protein